MGTEWAYAQSNLFDAQAAEVALNDAVKRVDKNADPGWIDAAVDAVRLIARYRSKFTTDPVWAILERREIEKSHEDRAMGAVMRRAQKLKLCEPTNEFERSLRPACHRRPVRVWRSLISLPEQGD